MSFFNMTTGTYTDYNDMLNKIKDTAISLGFTVVNHGDNLIGSNTTIRGTRLNLQKGNTFLNLAGADGINPSTTSGSLANNSKVIQCSISNTYNSSFWYVTYDRIKTSQVGENNTYYIFTKDDGFLVCMKISARQYTFINFLNLDSYNSANTLKCCSAGRFSGSQLASSDYNTTIQAYVHYPFLCHKSLYYSSSSAWSHFDVLKNEQTTFLNARFNFLTPAFSGSANVYSNQFSYGYNSITSPLGKSKSPFSAKSSPFLIDIRECSSATSRSIKLGAIKDMYVVSLDGYESGEIFDVGSGSTTETYICLPFFEKPPASETTDIYGYNLGVIIKIGEVNA